MSRVLVVDDDPDVLETLKEILSDKGFKVETVSEQDEIYPNIVAFEPQVILLDVKLKGSDGRNICKGLKNHYKTKNIPVILFSGDSQIKNQYKECLAEAFLEKPLRVRSLVKHLKDYSFKGSGLVQKTA